MFSLSSYKTLLRSVIVLLTGLFFINNIQAQYFNSGQDPFSVKWLQINTKNFKLIFPEEFQSKSLHLAKILDKSYRPASFSLNYKPGKIPILLHAHTIFSNGMVGWAPKRMELYSVPPQDNISSDWFTHLAIHEYRHVVQIDKSNQGLTKFLGFFTGELAAIGVVGLHIPFWFIEGDAVLLETTMTKSGRGRDPAFEMELRAQILEKGAFHYDKAAFGSYKDFVPNHYKLGYFLVAGARKKYGYSVWNKTLNFVANKPYLLSAFSKGLKKYTGVSKTGLYRSIIDDLETEWEIQKSLTSVELSDRINNPKKDFSNYINAHFIDNDNIIVEKTGISDIDRFVKINTNGDEEIVFTPGWYFHGSMSYANDLLVWAEIQQDPRWGHRSWSIINSYNIKTKKLKQLSNKSKYFSPAISPDGSTIAVIELDIVNKCRIVFIDYHSGQINNIIEIPDDLFIMTPSWNTNNKNLVVLIQNKNGKSLAVIDLETEKISYHTDFQYTEISNPRIYDNNIVFTGAWSGIDNIYSLNINTGDINLIGSTVFGAEHPAISPDDSKIVFSTYSSLGYDLNQSNLKNVSKTPLNMLVNNSNKIYESSVLQEKYQFSKEVVNVSNYKPVKYSRLKNLFNIHSWAPLGINMNNTTLNPGVSLFSQNVLGTMTAGTGYAYNIIEGTGNYFANITYLGLYPQISIDFGTGNRKINHLDNNGNMLELRWKENNISVKISQPLNFTKGKYSRGIRPSINLNFKDLEYIKDTPDNWSFGKIKSIEYSFLVYNNMKKSKRDLYPKWGQIVSLAFKNTPFNRNLSGSIMSAEGALFLPGLFKHHGLRIYIGYQDKITEDYAFIDNIPYPRSVYGETNNKLLSIRSDYKFPLIYPDFSFSGISYIKRIKMGIFNDLAYALYQGEEFTYWSTGIEITSDLHLFRFKAPFDLGFRLSYQPNNQKLKFEFLYQLDLYGI